MAPNRKGTFLWRNARCMIRVRVPARLTLTLKGCADDREATARLEQIQSLANRLIEAGKGDVAPKLARELAAAATAAERKPFVALAERALAGRMVEEKKLRIGMTVREFAKTWTSGELHEKYPDHVKLKRSAGKDAGNLKKHVLKHIGDLPLVTVDLGHIEQVMREIPEGRSSATRRHVAQVLHRLFKLAVYPAKLIPASPLPQGFLPRLQKGRATAYLYPKDDTALLGYTNIPVERRLLYGFLHREGMRREEAVQLSWDDVDLEAGLARLDENKTDDPRAWALDPGTAEALRRWLRLRDEAGELTERIFGDAPLPDRAADQYRADVAAAGIARPELEEKSARRRPLRVHDTRTAFVTIALANGRPERWVMDRTGHTSSAILQRYHRAARTAAELRLGSWGPLHDLIPELARLGSDWDPGALKRIQRSRNLRKTPGFATDGCVGKDLKSSARKGVPVRVREGLPPEKTSAKPTTGGRVKSGPGSQSDPNGPPTPSPGGPPVAKGATRVRLEVDGLEVADTRARPGEPAAAVAARLALGSRHGGLDAVAVGSRLRVRRRR